MSQANVKAEKGVICGERDGTLPPGYRQADLVSWRSYIFLTFPFFLFLLFYSVVKVIVQPKMISCFKPG